MHETDDRSVASPSSNMSVVLMVNYLAENETWSYSTELQIVQSLCRTGMKRGSQQFFGFGVYLLKSRFLIEDKHRFPWHYFVRFDGWTRFIFSASISKQQQQACFVEIFFKLWRHMNLYTIFTLFKDWIIMIEKHLRSTLSVLLLSAKVKKLVICINSNLNILQPSPPRTLNVTWKCFLSW